jgi:glycosyltransferase involved in cell wall biosynthesis
MKRDAVSVALAAFNGEKYIARQIDSIHRQSVPVQEIIVCDDGSTDSTRDIVRRLQKRIPTIRLLTNKQNLGLNKNFEFAIRQCTGQLIALSDQDNIWVTQKIEKMIAHMHDHLLVYSDSLVVDEAEKPVQRLTESKKYRFTDGRSPKAFFFYNSIFGHNMLFKRELTEHILPFPPSGINYDGWIAFVASCIGSIGYIDEPLVHYRLHPGNLTHPASSEKTPSTGTTPKWQRRRQYNARLIERLKIFATFERIEPSERRFLVEFIRELERLEHSYFNTRLLQMMLFHAGTLLHYKRPVNVIGKTFSQATGDKLRRLFQR